jgi:hypothetical protein
VGNTSFLGLLNTDTPPSTEKIRLPQNSAQALLNSLSGPILSVTLPRALDFGLTIARREGSSSDLACTIPSSTCTVPYFMYANPYIELTVKDPCRSGLLQNPTYSGI